MTDAEYRQQIEALTSLLVTTALRPQNVGLALDSLAYAYASIALVHPELLAASIVQAESVHQRLSVAAAVLDADQTPARPLAH